MATSCSQEEIYSGNTVPDGTEVSVNLVVNTPDGGYAQTKAYSDGTTAKKLQYAIYEVTKADDGSEVKTLKKTETTTINISTQLTEKLITGRKYSLVFWAGTDKDYTDATEPYTVEFGTDGAKMTVNYRGEIFSNLYANDENLDAFTNVETFEVTGDIEKTIYLYRPFAQVNIGTNDKIDADKLGQLPNRSYIKFKGPKFYDTLDLFTGEVSYQGVDDNSNGMNQNPAHNIEFDYNAIPENEKFPLAGYDYVAMAYILMPKGEVSEAKQLVDVEFTYCYENEEGETINSVNHNVTYVPVQGNWRTNIYGSVYTSDAKLNVEIKPAFEGEFNYGPDSPVDEQRIRSIADIGGTCVIEHDFELREPIMFTASCVIDLNGHTITYKGDSKDEEGDFAFYTGPDLVTRKPITVEFRGEGGIVTTKPDVIPIWIEYGANVIIENASVIAENCEHAIFAYEGFAYLKGGYYKSIISTFNDGTQKYMTINCLDDYYDAGKANFIVSGGIFQNFNPGDNGAERGGHTNFLAPGYKSVKIPTPDFVEDAQDSDEFWMVVPEDLNVISGNEDNRTKMQQGGSFLVWDDQTMNNTFNLTKDTDIDLNGNSFSFTSGGTYGDSMVIGNGANVTIKNGEIKAADDSSAEKASATILVKTASASHVTLEDVIVTGIHPVYLNSSNPATTVTINSGTFYTTYDSSNPDKNAPAVYVGKGSSGSTTGGKVTIYGGTFGSPDILNNFLLNVEDVLRKQQGKTPRDFIEVFGGKFYNFNPANNKAEGEGTNFVADGYTVVESTEGNATVFTVVKK